MQLPPSDAVLTPQSEEYVLGCHAEELERLGRQHGTWRDDCRAAWQRAGFGSGDRLLDLGCGPGFASVDLARLVGPRGAVLGIDRSGRFLEHLRTQARSLQLGQVQALQLDLGQPQQPPAAVAAASWDGAWCRWLAMFLPSLDPLLDLVLDALRPGGRLVLQEYVRWDTLAIHPGAPVLQRFVQRCIGHWRRHGGDPDVAARLPRLLEQRGLRLQHCRSLMACCPAQAPKAAWLRDFLTSYPHQLIEAGLWSRGEQQALLHELDDAQRRASLWVTPALVEMVWIKP